MSTRRVLPQAAGVAAATLAAAMVTSLYSASDRGRHGEFVPAVRK